MKIVKRRKYNMIKTEPRLKELSIDDKGNIIETVSDFVIGRDENGLVYYMPYLKEYAMVVALALHAIDGVTFEKDDNVYDSATKDEDIYALIKYFLNDKINLVVEIENQIDDVIDFKKNYIIHNNHILTNKILDILEVQKSVEDMKIDIGKKENRILEQHIYANDYQICVMNAMSPETTAKLNEKLATGEFDQSKFVKAVLENYIKSDLITSKVNSDSKGNILEMKSHTGKSVPVTSSKKQNSTKPANKTKINNNK